MLYLGVDLGGTNIKAALVNSEGEILCEAGIPTNLPRPAEAVCDDIATLCLQLAEGKDVAGVGVGCPGTVDGGTVLYSNNLDWHDFAMEEYLAQKTGLPVAVGNDANVAALGEALAGCAKGAQSTVVVTLGTGVGAGVVDDVVGYIELATRLYVDSLTAIGCISAIGKDIVDNHTVTTGKVSLIVVVVMEETVCHHKLAVYITEVEGWHTTINGSLEKLVLERSRTLGRSSSGIGHIHVVEYHFF